MSNNILNYKKPASPSIWEEALPLGNGSFGAMIYGGISEELIRLNEETVWYGSFRNRINPDAKISIDQIRNLLRDGQLEKAETLAYSNMFGTPMSQGHYEPLANLKLVFLQSIPHHSEFGKERLPNYTNYSRSLNLTTSTYENSYTLNQITYHREAFISKPDQVMAIRIKTNGYPISFRIELDRSDNFEEVSVKNTNILLKGYSGGNGSKFAAMIQVECTDGIITRTGSYLSIIDTCNTIIYVTGRTNYYNDIPENWCAQILKQASIKGYEKLKTDHIKDYQNLYNRVNLSLTNNFSYNNLTTDQRLHQFHNSNKDLGLVELYFNYGRYLLISCSRQGSLPANLQGLWSKDMQPPWGCKYTININTQMNYWSCEVTNLQECHTPLFKHIKRMAPHGKEVASKMYGCRGIMAHHNTDIYGDCAPQDQWMPATIWPMGFAWLSTHIIEHYRYHKELSFAEEYYEILCEASLFFIDYLTKDESGQLVTSPSTSPENTYILENGEKSALCYGPTMDTQIIRELWTGLLEISKDLHKESPLLKQIRTKLTQLPKTKIGSHGQILEWTKEYKEWDRGHRHISHLYGLFPGSSITYMEQPDLFHAAKVTLQERLSNGGGHTGWSRAWIINMYARLANGEEAYHHITKLLTQSTADNLFDMHPPFQIDGNLGCVSGIAEMLLQSHEHIIHLLPAIPSLWNSGHITGLKARGNITIDIFWENHIVRKARFQSPLSQLIFVKINETIIQLHLTSNEVYLYEFN